MATAKRKSTSANPARSNASETRSRRTSAAKPKNEAASRARPSGPSGGARSESAKTANNATDGKRRPAEAKPGANARRPSAADRVAEGTVLRPNSKGAKVRGVLKREDGATIAAMIAATGWQAHSVRGFLSGTIRKKLGLEVTSSKAADGERRYSIVS